MDTASIQQKLEKVIATYPGEKERLEKCAELIAQQDTKMLNRAFEKQLDRILTATGPDDARKQIERMEHNLLKSPLLAPFLGGQEGSGGKQTMIAGVVIGLLIVVTGVSFWLRASA